MQLIYEVHQSSSHFAIITIRKISILVQIVVPIIIPTMLHHLAFFDASSACAVLPALFARLTYTQCNSELKHLD